MPKAKIINRFSFGRRAVWASLVALALLVGSALAYTSLRDSSSITSESGQKANLNLDPPTETEKQETEAHKRSLTEGQPTPPTASNKMPVTPVITSADKNSVRAYVQGIFEDDGTCTATATKGSQVITKSSTGFQNVSYTQCAPIEWSLSSGGWTVIVTYSSAAAEGKSEPKDINV